MIYDLSLGNSLLLTSELDCALQELDILFGTENTELIGYTDFGTNFEQFLWQMSPSPESLKSYILEKIGGNTYYLHKFKIDIEVLVTGGEIRNIYHVLITIEDPYSKIKKEKLYQFR